MSTHKTATKTPVTTHPAPVTSPAPVTGSVTMPSTTAAGATASPEPSGTGLLVGTPATPGTTGSTPGTASRPQPGTDQGPSASAIAAAQGPASALQGPATGGQGPVLTPTAAPHPAAHHAGVAVGLKGSHARVAGLIATAKLRKPKGNQAELAAAFAGEIRRSDAAGTYRAYFGPHAPDPATFATELEQAGNLSVQEAQESVRLTTLRNERNKSWDQVLTEKVDAFIPCYELALANDANVATDFQTAGVFLRTNKAIGARGAATRKAKKINSTPAGG